MQNARYSWALYWTIEIEPKHYALSPIFPAMSFLCQLLLWIQKVNIYLRWTHLPRPDRRPDALATWWATRWLPWTRWTTRFSTWPKCENLVVQSGRLEQFSGQMKLASVHIYLIGPDIWPKGSSSFQNLVAQEPSGHPLGRQSIWSPIRSPEHLVAH